MNVDNVLMKSENKVIYIYSTGRRNIIESGLETRGGREHILDNLFSS
jgi:hypothetical protein